jgi:hypothetical protein
VANTDRVRLAFIHAAGEMTVRCARYLAGEENDAGSSAKSRARVAGCVLLVEEGWLRWKLARKQPVRQSRAGGSGSGSGRGSRVAAHSTGCTAQHSTACFPRFLSARQNRAEPKMLRRLKMGSTGG